MNKGSQALHTATLTRDERVYDVIRYMVRMFPGYSPCAADIRVRTQLSAGTVRPALQRLRRAGRILCADGDGWTVAPDQP